MANKPGIAGALPEKSELLPLLLAPQPLLSLVFNGWLLVYYLAGRLSLGEIAAFYFFEIGLYMCLYLPRALFHILADRAHDWRWQKEELSNLVTLLFTGLFLPMVLVNSYTHAMTGYREQLALVAATLKLALVPFALQFCFGAFQFLARSRDKYAYKAVIRPLWAYALGQAAVFAFLFFIAVPGWLLTGSFKPGVAAFLVLRVCNDLAQQLVSRRLDEELELKAARQGAGH